MIRLDTKTGQRAVIRLKAARQVTLVRNILTRALMKEIEHEAPHRLERSIAPSV